MARRDCHSLHIYTFFWLLSWDENQWQSQNTSSSVFSAAAAWDFTEAAGHSADSRSWSPFCSSHYCSTTDNEQCLQEVANVWLQGDQQICFFFSSQEQQSRSPRVAGKMQSRNCNAIEGLFYGLVHTVSTRALTHTWGLLFSHSVAKTNFVNQNVKRRKR